MLTSVQHLRAIAALAVAAFHFRPLFIQFGGSRALARWADAGYAGVDIFFVIAGVVMAWTTRFEMPPGRFLWRRFCRIYLSYWPIAIVFLFVTWRTTGLPDDLNLPGSLLLVEPRPRHHLIYAAWTLPFELLFYAMFAFALAWGRRRFLLGAIVVTAAVVSVGCSGLLPSTPSWLLTNPLNLEFAIGVALGHLARSRALDGRLAAVAAIGAVALLSGAFAEPRLDGGMRALQLGGGSALLLYAALWIDQARRTPAWPALRLLGDASYAIYLLHVPLLYVLDHFNIARAIVAVAGIWLLPVVYFALLTAAGTAYYLVVERPFMAWSRSVGAPREVA